MKQYILRSADEKPITKKTEVSELIVILDLPLIKHNEVIFTYDKSQVPNPDNINVAGIYMYIADLKDNGIMYDITDGADRKFYLYDTKN